MSRHETGKCLDAVNRAKFFAESLLKTRLSHEETPGIEAYKIALKCRLEVQYAIALLRLEYSSEAQPPKTSRSGLESYLSKINDALSSGIALLNSGEDAEALDTLLTADALLGKAIGIMRRSQKCTSLR